MYMSMFEVTATHRHVRVLRRAAVPLLAGALLFAQVSPAAPAWALPQAGAQTNAAQTNAAQSDIAQSSQFAAAGQAGAAVAADAATDTDQQADLSSGVADAGDVLDKLTLGSRVNDDPDHWDMAWGLSMQAFIARFGLEAGQAVSQSLDRSLVWKQVRWGIEGSAEAGFFTLAGVLGENQTLARIATVLLLVGALAGAAAGVGIGHAWANQVNR